MISTIYTQLIDKKPNPMTSPLLSSKDIDKAATAITRLLRELGYTFCFSGGTACYYYGATTIPSACSLYLISLDPTNENPQSIDIIILDAQATEDSLKSQIIAKDDKFYLLLPNPRTAHSTAMYQVLYYWLTPKKTASGEKPLFQPGRSQRPGRSYKIDFQFPHLMSIRSLPKDRIVSSRNRPLTPILPLVLFLLQRWHNSSTDAVRGELLAVDVKEALMILTRKYPDVKLDENDSWPRAWFINRGKENVEKFLGSYPGTKDQWTAIGF
jgi:hypothetical protein